MGKTGVLPSSGASEMTQKPWVGKIRFDAVNQHRLIWAIDSFLALEANAKVVSREHYIWEHRPSPAEKI